LRAAASGSITDFTPATVLAHRRFGGVCIAKAGKRKTLPTGFDLTGNPKSESRNPKESQNVPRNPRVFVQFDHSSFEFQ
jgi:hypothetical protein